MGRSNLFLGIAIFCLLSGCDQGRKSEKLALTPPIGWNSFDSYGVYLHEEAAMANLEAMADKLKQYGYEYFVIDNGWFGEYRLKPGTIYAAEKHASDVNINNYGLLQPSKTYFPNGLKQIAARAHELGLKFGVHLMRGIPRKAVELNTQVKGTQYHARDIADTTSICSWCHYNYGVDMSKPGAQEFYNSLVAQLAGWGVDFIKADDIVPFPKEIEGLANAIARCGRPMVLSLSPGGNVDVNSLDYFKRGNMLRVTKDIWDEQKGIDESFNAWRKWQGKEEPGFWIDMDMIPFGELQIMSPNPFSQQILKNLSSSIASNERMVNLAGKGWNRRSNLNKNQMYTFITIRALAASPLMMGGDLPSLDEFSLSLITSKDMLACNQNGVMGSLVFDQDSVEVWNTKQKQTNNGWIGIFNRTSKTTSFVLETEKLGINSDMEYVLTDVWMNKDLSIGDKETIEPKGVIFLRYDVNK